MNKLGILLGCFIILMACNFTKPVTSNHDYCKQLIGTWEYIETRNEEDEIITFYDEKFGELTMKIMTVGPTIILFPDKSYKKIFTPENTDTGYWSFNNSTMTIEYDLCIDSTTLTGELLIENGQAIKQKDGKYYERIEDKVVLFEREKLVIDELGRKVVFQKKK